MTQQHAKLLLPVITAFAEGKTVQVQKHNGMWEDTEFPHWDEDTSYRIKPQPREWWIKVAGKYDESDAIYSYRVADAIHVREVLE